MVRLPSDSEINNFC